MIDADGKKNKCTAEEREEYDLFINSLVGVIRKYGIDFLEKKDK